MRKLSLIILALIGTAVFFACEDDMEPVVKLESNIAMNALEEGDYEPVLSDDIADSSFTVFSWQPPQYNVDVITDYVVQVDTAGNNFENAAEVTSVSDTNSVSVTVFEFNKVLTKDLGIPADVNASVDIRVGSVLGANSPRIDYSDPVTISVQTYEPPFEPEELMVYGAEGSLGNLKPVTYDAPEGTYEGYIYIPAGGGEIQFGDAEQTKMLGNDEPTAPDDDMELNSSLFEGQGAIPVDSGYYKVTVNTYSNTYDMFITDWGVIGSGIPPYDWSEDVDMTYHPEDDIWTVTVEAEAAEFKFRPNDEWNPLNYGDGPVDDYPDYVADGHPDEYGANIPIEAGMKKITLDLSEYPYSFSVEDAK